MGSKTRTFTQNGAIHVFRLPLTADERSKATIEPEAQIPAVPDASYPTASLDVKLAAYTTETALICIDWDGKEIWRYDFNRPTQQFMNGTATPEFSLDGRVIWLYLPDQAWRGRDFVDTIAAFDAAQGTLLAKAELGSAGHGAGFYACPESEEMLVEVGEGQDGCSLYQLHLLGDSINVLEYESVRGLFVLDVSPTFRQFLTTDDYSKLHIHTYPGGSVVRELTVDQFNCKDACSIGPYPGGYLDQNTAIVNLCGESEQDEEDTEDEDFLEEWNQLYLVDVNTGQPVGPLGSPTMDTREIHILGDGVWISRGSNNEWCLHNQQTFS